MIRLSKIAVPVLFILAAALVGGAIYWNASTLGPSSEALAALQTGADVRVTQADGLIVFEPAGSPASTGLIFYPGGRVDYRSYAPVLRAVASEGFLVALVQMPLNLAFLDTGAAGKVIAQHPEIEHWAVGGHSLGGVAAATYAARSPTIEGLVLWAAYPGDGALAGSDLRVISIFGSSDGLSTPADIEASRRLLPQDAQFVAIQGGNHAQFGSYGPQDGDNPATISAEEQASQVAIVTASFLHALAAGR